MTRGWRRRSLLLAALLAGAAASAPAAAQEPEPCVAVLGALHGLSAVPRYHWSLTATTPARRRPMEREQIVIDDDVYLTPDEGRWMKQRIPVADRVARLDAELARQPVRDCRRLGPETVQRHAATLYTYHQGVDGGDDIKRIWIDTANGLPLLFKSTEGPVSVTMRVDYDEVAAPLP